MPRTPRPIRTLRVEDALWSAAQAKCQAEGLVLSEVIRQFLTEFTGPTP